MNKKMADVNIDPFGGMSGEHESRPVEGGSTGEPEHEQETSFRGESQRTKLMKDYVNDLYKKLSENIGETPEAFDFDYFRLKDGELYYRVTSEKSSEKALNNQRGAKISWSVSGYTG